MKKNGWGLIDSIGDEIIQPQFDNFDFLPGSEQDLYLISNNQVLYGMFDTLGKNIIPVRYHSIREPKEDRVAVKYIECGVCMIPKEINLSPVNTKFYETIEKENLFSINLADGAQWIRWAM